MHSRLKCMKKVVCQRGLLRVAIMKLEKIGGLSLLTLQDLAKEEI